MQLNLHLQQSDQVLLNIQTEIVIRSTTASWPLCSLRSNLVVCAWKQNLKKVRVVKFSIFVWVKKLYHEVAVGLVDIGDSVVTEEIQKFHGSDEAILVSIDPAEDRVWLKHLVGTQEHTQDVKLLLKLDDAVQQVAEAYLRSFR